MRAAAIVVLGLAGCAPDWNVVCGADGCPDTDPAVVPTGDTLVRETDVEDSEVPAVDTEPVADADADTVADAADVCPGLDDRVDLDGNGTPDCAETLVPNGQLATEIAPWTTRTVGRNRATVAFEAGGDASGWVGSGAALVENTTSYADANAAGLVSPCLAGDPGDTFHLWFHARVDAADVPGEPVQIVPSYLVYADAGCTVPVASVTLGPPALTLDAWTTLHPAGPLVLEDGWHGFQVQLELFKPGTDAPVRFRLDDVLVARR